MVSISFDASMLIQLVNFILLMAAMNFFLYKPLRKILAERRQVFDRLKEEASKAKAAIDDGENEKARQNAESVRAALTVKNELVQRGLAEEKSILAQAQTQAAAHILEMRTSLAESQEKAREALARESESIARSMAEKVLGRTL